MKTIRTIICFSFILGLQTVASLAQTLPGHLGGVVVDATGGALGNVTVTVTRAASGETRAVVTTAEGRYDIHELAAGRYLVEASLAGFAPRTTAIDITGEAATLDFVLSVSSLFERVTVTATKTGAADIQATPVAVTALPATTLEQLGVETVGDLAGFVPTLTVSQNTSLAQVTIRGIGSNLVLAGSDPSSTIHLDGVYLARPAMVFADLLDVERVEILRGPQGTLYGRNSVGGTINIVSRQPGDTFETNVRLTAGNYDKLRAEGVISGPLVKTKVMGSFAFLRGTRDGFVKDLADNDHSLGSEDTWAGRGQLRVVLGARGDLRLSADHGRFDGIPLTYAKPILTKPGFSFEQPASLWTVRTSDRAAGENIQQGASAKLSIRVNDTTMVNSLTAYRQSQHRFFIDADLTELSLQANDVRDLQHQVSEEVTIVGHTPKLAWVGGAFFFNEHNRGPVLLTLYRAATQNRPDATFDTHAWAVFGQATYQLSRRVSLTGGLRNTDEEKDLENTGGVYRLGTASLADPASFYHFTDRARYTAWTPKISVQAQATPGTFFYGSATRGFKSGGFNASWPAPGRPYNPEFAWTYEAGLKQSTAGGHAHLNTAVFHTDYRDLQVQQFIRTGLFDISNAASANITGVELEGAASGRGVQLAGNLSWLNATYETYFIGTVGRTGAVAGNSLNNAPQWSGSASAVYEFPTGAFGTVSVRGDVSWQTRVFFTPFNDDVETQKARTLLHLRAGFESRQRRWAIAVYVRNLANSRYITGTTGGPLPAVGGRPGEPRFWGTQLTLRR